MSVIFTTNKSLLLDSIKEFSDEVDYYKNLASSSVLYGNSYYSPFVLRTTNYFPYVSGTYTNLDDDKTIQNTIAKFFLYKILDKWLYKEMNFLLSYVKKDGDKYTLVTSLSDLEKNNSTNDTKEIREQKINYLSNILINKKLVRHILKNITEKNKIHWYHLKNHKSEVKKSIAKYLKSKLEKKIDNK